jgi:RND superfamily putative drug exporter
VFARLGSWCHARRRTVLALWVLGLVLLVGALQVVGSSPTDEVNLPNVESARGITILKEAFGGQGAGDEGKIVFRSEAGVQDPAVRAAMEKMLATVDALPQVTVHSPYAEGGGFQVSTRGRAAGKIAFATVELPAHTSKQVLDTTSRVLDRATPHIPGLQVELGGKTFSHFQTPHSEIIGVAFAIMILVLAFGSVLAMGLPIGVALAGIGVGITVVGLASNVVSVPDYANQLGMMIGLGVGIDYALFIVTRFRENYHHGHTVEEATSIAIDTAGRAVAFAGSTVVVSFLGMFLMGLAFVQGLAIGAAIVVAVTVVASLTLLPALLGFVGEKIEVTRWRGLVAIVLLAIGLVGIGLGVTPLIVALPLVAVVLAASFAFAPLRREVPRRPVKHLSQTLWYRWSRWIQHHPLKAAVTGTVVLAVFALPMLGLRLGFSDDGNLPKSSTTRRAYDLLADGFGPGSNGLFILTARVAPDTQVGELSGITAAVRADKGVEQVTDAFLDDPAHPTAAVWQVIPTTSPQDAATSALVNRLRHEVLPSAERAAGVHAIVTGGVAADVDFSEYLSARLPLFFGAVLSVSFLLLMAVFRSVLVPLKAVIMNLLSIGASYGVVVAIFQWGWLSSLVHVAPAPIEPVVPMMLFAIVFGLSMDYEVFLLSRVREEYHRTGDSHLSVANGLAASARVITAAAAIMVFVFGSFLLETDRIVKLFGVGLAVAVLLDATIVRMLLVPATMELLGDKNWWLPKWLDRLLPNIDVEGHGDSLGEELDEDAPRVPAFPPVAAAARVPVGAWGRELQVGEAHVQVGLLDAPVDLDDLPGDVPARR